MTKNNYNISKPTRSLILMTGLCFLLFSTRYFRTGELIGFALVWNLFLAWIPLFFALFARRFYKNDLAFLSYFSLGFWLLFFPNAPYIITDLVHLNHLPTHLWWYDSLGIFTAALTGLAIGIYSLSVVHTLFEKLIGRSLAWGMVLVSIFLSGFGIYLGRFSRFNSWDLFTNPMFLIRNSYHEAFNPLAIKLTVVFSLVLTVLYVSIRLLKFQPDENQ